MAYGVSLYLAGPMHGIEELNYPAFNHAAKGLRGLGFTVVNPAEFEDDYVFGLYGGEGETEVSPLERAAYLRRDFGALVECDGIVMLPGWEQSKGANAELAVAKMVGLGVFVLDVVGTGNLRAAPRLRFLWGRVVDHINEVENDFVQYQLGGYEE